MYLCKACYLNASYNFIADVRNTIGNNSSRWCCEFKALAQRLSSSLGPSAISGLLGHTLSLGIVA